MDILILEVVLSNTFSEIIIEYIYIYMRLKLFYMYNTHKLDY